MSGINKKIMIAITAVLVVVVGFAGWQYFLKPSETPKPTDQTPEVPVFSIMVYGLDGTAKNFTSVDFKAIQKAQSLGGFKTSAGSIRGPYNLTGVKLTDVLALVGGISEGNSLRVTAADDYSMVYTWKELSGKFLTFSAKTGDEVNATKPLTPVLAYLQDGKLLPKGDGPIRFVVLGEEGLITEGHFWIKQTVKIEVIKGIQDWTISLIGARNETMDRATFESGANCPDTTPQHKASYVDADGKIWTGVPLWLLVGRIDDLNTHETGAYNRTLADTNAYVVKVVSGDGYTVELNSTFVKLNQDIFLANELDGEPLVEPYWPLRLVGSDLTKGQMVRNVVKLELAFQEPTPIPSTEDTDIIANATWSLKLTGHLNETLSAKTFIEGSICDDSVHLASWTDADGHIWAGMPLWYLVGRVDDADIHGAGAFNRTLADEGYIVRVIASDGFSQDLNSTLVKENNDIFVAYKVDGKALGEDSAPLRVVGPNLTKKQMIRKLVEISLVFP